MDEVNAHLPEGYRIRPIYQRTELIGHTVATVGENLLVGAVLVTAIPLVFLRNLRAAVIVAAIIPLSLLFAFILMHAMGVSANLISWGGGLRRDHRQRGGDGGGADGAPGRRRPRRTPRHRLAGGPPPRPQTDLRRAGLADHVLSKAIIIVAFLPIFTFQRVEGRIFTPVALTLSFAPCWAA